MGKNSVPKLACALLVICWLSSSTSVNGYPSHPVLIEEAEQGGTQNLQVDGVLRREKRHKKTYIVHEIPDEPDYHAMPASPNYNYGGGGFNGGGFGGHNGGYNGGYNGMGGGGNNGGFNGGGNNGGFNGGGGNNGGFNGGGGNNGGFNGGGGNNGGFNGGGGNNGGGGGGNNGGGSRGGIGSRPVVDTDIKAKVL